ncbi:MAG: PAS domain S-box protein [Halobacteriales archaeon]|nr:PAS domain S-box protein [Halobacteriales archaeon]
MGSNADRIRVLHVDDEPEFVELAQEALTATSDRLDVRGETDVERALERLATEPVDCVVSDYDMPGLDGLELLEAVRERDEDLPFILFTGTGSEEVASDAISAGVTDYLQKEPGSSQFDVLANRITNAVSKRRAEGELRRVRDRMTFALETTDAVVFETDVESGAETRHGPFERLFGLPETAVPDLASFYDRAVHPEDRSTVEERQADVIDGLADSVQVEFRTHPDNGPVRWVRSSMAREPAEVAGDGTSVIGLTSAVTAQKEREQALQASEERYRRLLATAPTPIFVYSFEGELIYANEAAVSFVGGESREELLGSTISDFTHPESRAIVEERRRTLVEDREPVPPIEEKLVSLDGEVKQAILAAAPVDFEGEPAIQTVAADITAVKEREAELERQVERLDEFASIVSHDLRNPLSVARGRVELAMEGLAEGDVAGAVEDLERASTALERMEGLIEDLLSLARYGDAVVDAEAVDLRAVARQCWQTVSTDEAVLDVETRAVIRADRGRLRQLLENLIRNAVQHAGPAVRVRIGDLEDGFYVEDDGPGIPADDRERVFEHGHSTAADGNGFGLSIVQQIAGAHEWAVRAAESEWGGARIEVTGVEPADPDAATEGTTD